MGGLRKVGRILGLIALGALMVFGWGTLVLGLLVFQGDPGEFDGGDLGTVLVGLAIGIAATLGLFLLLRRRRKQPVQFPPHA